MPKLLGFETMLIIDPYGMAVDARVVAGLVFSLLFKLVSSYCGISFHTYQSIDQLSYFCRRH